MMSINVFKKYPGNKESSCSRLQRRGYYRHSGLADDTIQTRRCFSCLLCVGLARAEWLGSRVVSVLDSGAEGSGFKSQPRRCPVTALGKLFTPIVPLFTKQQNW